MNASADPSQERASGYRAYLMGRDGRIETSVTIYASNDEEAVREAEGLTRTYELEVWDRSRIVIRLPSKTLR